MALDNRLVNLLVVVVLVFLVVPSQQQGKNQIIFAV
jgi:hypothetical protein